MQKKKLTFIFNINIDIVAKKENRKSKITIKFSFY